MSSDKMAKTMFAEISGSLTSLVPPEWFTDLENSSIWLRLYTALFIPHAKFKAVVETFASRIDKSQPLLAFQDRTFIGWGTLKGMKIPIMTATMFAEESGQLRLEAKVDERELAQTNYIFLGAPFQVDGKPGDEAVTKRLLDTAAGLICLHTGQNFMRHCVFEGEIKARDGTFSCPSESWKMPQPSEGPYLNPQNACDIAEISTRITCLREPKRSRIQLALQLIDTAMRKHYGFFEYWTALEVVCDGKANRVKEKLKQIYRLQSHKEAGEKTGLEVLAKWRGEYVHKGKRPTISADVERYIQLVFLDLLRAEIDVPARHHIAAIQGARGYDLSPLGLADNRTEEQRRASQRYAEQNIAVKDPVLNHPLQTDCLSGS